MPANPKTEWILTVNGKRFYITPQRFNVLCSIMVLSPSFDGLVPVKRIQKDVSMNRSAIAKHLMLLKKAGLINNRIRGCWCLTEKGNSLLSRLSS